MKKPLDDLVTELSEANVGRSQAATAVGANGRSVCVGGGEQIVCHNLRGPRRPAEQLVLISGTSNPILGLHPGPSLEWRQTGLPTDRQG